MHNRIFIRLLVYRQTRIGLEDVKGHPFFNGVDWNVLRSMKAPYIPSDQFQRNAPNDEEIRFDPSVIAGDSAAFE